ncbi:MAG: heavy-metal-associated domain-containing protein [Lachnospiraceae bacterium]|nr:heavy-metal-associated domain-containing protein [Lachnospiraceae bacterium]
MYQTIAKVDGMMCNMCESHINEMIRKKFVVKKVSSSHKKNETVIISDKPISKDELEAGLSEMGYHCLDAKSEEYVKKGLFKK